MQISLRATFIGGVLTACAGVLAAQEDFQTDPALVRMLELGREDNRVEQPLRFLTQEVGHRLTGSTNLQRACEWAVAQFRELGLDARLERWGEFPVGFDRHAWSGRMVAPESMELTFITRAWTAGTPGPVRAAAALYPESLAALEASPQDYRGAWIVRRRRADMPDSDERSAIDEALAELQAAGEVRSGGAELLITGGRWSIDPEDLPDEVSVRLLEEQYLGLLERLEGGEAVELEFDIDNRFLPGPFPLYNVIADLKGTDFPDEYVLVGGHLDSWDGAEGAQDNGTGVATTLEAARLIVASGARPRRTIRFTLWTGEEQGLLGSTAYVEAHPELLPKISAVLIHDGGTNYLSGISAPEGMAQDLHTAFAAVTDFDPEMPFEVQEVGGLPRGGGSDHVPFVRAGVPGFFWKQSGETSYRFVHHTQHDTFENARQDYQRHSAVVVAVGAYNLSRLEGLLDRTNLVVSQPRRMGVFLEGTRITGVNSGSKAAEAGWVEGDVILAIDDVEISSRRALQRELQRGEAQKTFMLQRGEETLESVLDWSDTPGEIARSRRDRGRRGGGEDGEDGGDGEGRRGEDEDEGEGEGEDEGEEQP